jgi:hypothetical protein
MTSTVLNGKVNPTLKKEGERYSAFPLCLPPNCQRQMAILNRKVDPTLKNKANISQLSHPNCQLPHNCNLTIIFRMLALAQLPLLQLRYNCDGSKLFV